MDYVLYCPKCNKIHTEVYGGKPYRCFGCGARLKKTSHKRANWNQEKQYLHIFDGKRYPEKKLTFHLLYAYVFTTIDFIGAIIILVALLSTVAENQIAVLQNSFLFTDSYRFIFIIVDLVLCFTILKLKKRLCKELFFVIILRHLFITAEVAYIVLRNRSSYPTYPTSFFIVYCVPQVIIVVYYLLKSNYFFNEIYVAEPENSFEEGISYIHICPECLSPVYYSFEQTSNERCNFCRTPLTPLGITLKDYRKLLPESQKELIRKVQYLNHLPNRDSWSNNYKECYAAYCGYCGNRLPDGCNFCPFCGKKIVY